MKTTRKRFVMITGSGDTIAWFRLDLLKEIKAKNYEVFAFAPSITKHNRDLLHSNGIVFQKISLERKSLSFINFLTSWVQIIRIIKDLQPDLVFSYMHKPIIASGLASYFFPRIKFYCMVSGLGHVFERPGFLMALVRVITTLLLKISFLRANIVFFQNNDDKSTFLDKSLVSAKQVIVTNGSGVNLAKFYPSAFPEKPVFLTIARFLESKGIREFAEASYIVKSKFPEARFLIYGFHDEHKDSIPLEEIKDHWPEKYGIEYMGYIKEPLTAYQDCSAYVLLSYREGTPKTVLEAMACGRPIITTDVAGCRETVIDKLNGYLVPHKDPLMASKAMEKLCNISECKKMGKESLDIAMQRYDVSKVNSEILRAMQL